MAVNLAGIAMLGLLTFLEIRSVQTDGCTVPTCSGHSGTRS